MRYAFRLLPYAYLLLAVGSLLFVGLAGRLSLPELIHPDEDSPLLTLIILYTVVLVFAAVFTANAVLLLRRRGHAASLVLSGISCLAFPFGTFFGAFTLFALTREEIRRNYI